MLAYEVAALTVRYAAPHIVPRVMAELEAGQTVRFGPISLSKEKITFRGRSWPLPSVAGYRTFQGYWMMDVGPKEKPSLKIQALLSTIDNLFALLAALERYTPGRDYGDHSPDLGSALRPSASSHDPRYPAGRTRLLIVGGMIAVGALIWLGIHVESWWRYRQRDLAKAASAARLDEVRRAAEASPVPAGAPYKCDAEIKDLWDVTFVYSGQDAFLQPGMARRDQPFKLSSSGSMELGAHWDGPWYVLAQERALSPKDSKNQRLITLAVTLMDPRSKAVRC